MNEKTQDPERQEPNKLKSQEKHEDKDPNLVTFDENDSENPKCWSQKRKWCATLVVSMFTFISPVTSSMVAPALPTIAKDLSISSSSLQSMVLSVFVLAYAIGPLFLGPASEVFGRIPVLQCANLVFLAFNIGCSFARTEGEMIAFRFMAGFGGSVPLAIGSGVLSDIWSAEQRGKALSIYSAGPLLGPAVGPIAGGWIAEKTTWRWVFWSTSIYNGIVQLFGIFALQETYPPKLLARKAARLRKETGNMNLYAEGETQDAGSKLLGKLKVALPRPFIMMATQPIIQVLSLYAAYLYGTFYIVLTTFPGLWADQYHESPGIGGLNYISIGLGCTIGTQISAPLNDRIYIRLKNRHNGIGQPEFRIPLLFISSAMVPIGIFLYGWSADQVWHWIVPNIGIAIYAAGIIISFQCMSTFTVDAYTRYAASANSATSCLRSICGFAFPLFAPDLFATLGIGWGNSLLGFLAIGLGFPAPFLLWKYGQRLRAKSTYAAG